jgi:Cu-Zn family superoxide dismutase
MKMTFAAASAAILASSLAFAAPQSIDMKVATATGSGASLGKVAIEETKYGVVFTPSLSGLAPGVHGFHVHEKGNCGPELKDGKPGAALAAGGHYDPDNSKQHGLPWGTGHRGDLPALVVDAEGKATLPVLAPRLKLAELKGKALMIHAGGDNHADHPQPLGGGGARMACAVIE